MNVAVRGGDDDDAAAVGVGGATVVAEDDDPAVVVAVGDEAIQSAVRDPPEVPILPVTPAGGRHLVARDALDAAVAAVAAGDRRVGTHPILGLRHGDDSTRALRDVTLVTDAPASISEYAIAVGAERLGSVRADGVVVATPIGSDGYAAAAGGPVLEAGAGVSVVPIAPFSTAVDRRVVDLDTPLTVSVEREGAVAVVVDGVRHGVVDHGADLRVERAGSLDVVTPTRTENF